jgi:hypothetical protein
MLQDTTEAGAARKMPNEVKTIRDQGKAVTDAALPSGAAVAPWRRQRACVGMTRPDGGADTQTSDGVA